LARYKLNHTGEHSQNKLDLTTKNTKDTKINQTETVYNFFVSFVPFVVIDVQMPAKDFFEVASISYRRNTMAPEVKPAPKASVRTVCPF
jgi:hypothetical protein